MKNKKMEFIAIFKPAKEGGYNVSFPDFPGLVTFGDSFEEAKEKAKEALELWLEELEESEFDIPQENEKPIIYELTITR